MFYTLKKLKPFLFKKSNNDMLPELKSKINFNAQTQQCNPEITKYIKEQTNKWLQNYINKDYTLGINSYNLVDQLKLPNSYYFMSFVSLLSFLAGYNFGKFINM